MRAIHLPIRISGTPEKTLIERQTLIAVKLLCLEFLLDSPSIPWMIL